MNAATFKAQQGTKRFASVGLQQVGYQVGDFAVQLQGGTNAAVAFGQQFSQLAGIFGAGGAIAGAGVAIATAFIAPLLEAKKAAENLETSMESLQNAVSSLNNAVDLQEKSLFELIDTYGVLAVNIREAQAAAAEFAAQKAFLDLQESEALTTEFFQKIEAGFTSLKNAQEGIFDPLLEQNASDPLAIVEKNFSRMAESIGLSKEQAVSLGQAMRDFEEAADLQEKGRSAANLAVELSKIPEPIRLANREFFEAVQKLAETADMSAQAAEATRKISESTPGSGWMDSAITGVNGLINRIIEGINKVRILKGEAEGPSFVERYEAGEFPGTPNVSGFRSAEYFNLLDKQAMDAGKSRGTRGGGGGGRGGGKSPADVAQENLEKLREQLKVEQALIGKSEERKRIIKSLGVEIVNQNPQIVNGLETQIQQIDEMTQREQQLKSFGETIKNSLGDAFMSIVDGSKSAGDAFKDMARLVIKQAFDMLVIQPILDGLFGGGGGGGFLGGALSFLGFANGAAFSNGKVTAFADGGVVNQPTMFPMANGAGLMGEAGPEAVMPLKRGKNGKLGVQVEGGSQQPVVINQSFNFSANGDESVKRIIAQEAPKIANLTQKQILDQRRRGGVMKSTFG
jgi:hypothetical protein